MSLSISIFNIFIGGLELLL